MCIINTIKRVVFVAGIVTPVALLGTTSAGAACVPTPAVTHTVVVPNAGTATTSHKEYQFTKTVARVPAKTHKEYCTQVRVALDTNPVTYTLFAPNPCVLFTTVNPGADTLLTHTVTRTVTDTPAVAKHKVTSGWHKSKTMAGWKLSKTRTVIDHVGTSTGTHRVTITDTPAVVCPALPATGASHNWEIAGLGALLLGAGTVIASKRRRLN